MSAEAVGVPRAPAARRRLSARLDASGAFGLALLVVLLAVNLATSASSFSPGNLPATLGLATPVILASFAATPTLLVGNGGIDLSIGPLMGLVNVVVVHELIGRAGIVSAPAVIAAALALGLLVGLINGALVAYLRIQPIVATLGTYLVCSGLALSLQPSPGGSVPAWLASLAGSASVVTVAAVLIAWLAIRRLPFYVSLMATAGDERAVFASGIDTARVRIAAYAIGGLIAGVGGLALSAVLGSADATVGPAYTLTGIAAAAFGGVSLAGGRGGILRALVGALAIFLLQNFLTYLNVSAFLLQVAYGAVLVIAVALNGGADSALARLRRTR